MAMALSTVPKPAHGPALEGYPTGHLCPGSSKRTGYPGAFWPKVLLNTETDKEGDSEEVPTLASAQGENRLPFQPGPPDSRRYEWPFVSDALKLPQRR